LLFIRRRVLIFAKERAPFVFLFEDDLRVSQRSLVYEKLRVLMNPYSFP